LSLFDIIPENLFSILFSKNKNLYVKSLFVLLDVFKKHMIIKKSELISMLISNLEDEIISADFSDEDLNADEVTFSGRAHFLVRILVRKLKLSGWITLETGADFEDYVTLPNYSVKIIRLLNELSNVNQNENFAYVYSTYSSLKTANESGDAYEMFTALYDGAARTEQLVESLKMVYHDITYYNQAQIDMVSINKVLDSHFMQYRQAVVEKILRPLKIKDSVPKYKVPLSLILKKWLSDNSVIESMTNQAFNQNKFSTHEECRNNIFEKIYFILDTYESLEKNYISVIDDKNRQYTRATTQKIDYLINSDQSVKGNLIDILKNISTIKDNEKIFDRLSSAFEIYHQDFFCCEGLYERRNNKVRLKGNPLEVNDNDLDFSQKAQIAIKQMFNDKYSKIKINNFVSQLLNDKKEVSSKEINIENDETYIMTLLSVVRASDIDSFYTIEFLQEKYWANDYILPVILYKRKEPK